MANLEGVCDPDAKAYRGCRVGVETGPVFVRQKRSPASKPKGKAKAKAKRGKAAKSRGGISLFDGLEQRHLDFIRLFLVAAGIFLLFVLFFGWEGGKVGYGIETALEYLFGSVGARIFTLLMLVAGGMLLTGTSVSALARGIGHSLRAIFFGGAKASEATARTVRASSEEVRRRKQARDERTAETQAAQTDVMKDYPEDDDDFEPTVALAEDPEDDGIFAPGIFDFSHDEGEEATTEETRALSAPEPEPEPDLPEPEPVQQIFPELTEKKSPGTTPQGNLRGVTTSEEIDYQLPSPRVLERGKGDKGPDPKDQQLTGRKLIEALGHFGVEAKIVGVVSGPHVSLYELRLAPGIKVKKVTAPAEVLTAGRLARQGDRRQRGLDRHREDAARPRRRHHRLGQERLRQRDALLDPDVGLAERSAPGAGRPEASRAQPLRERPAPPAAGGDLAAARRQRARQPDHRDGDALRRDVAGPRPQPGGAEPDPPQGRRGAAAAHP